ncbi:MAG: hypothetical protein PUD04_01525, partial [Firmicutes bacterium]|nr:hypothetical protein [Bacillota bacterium]
MEKMRRKLACMMVLFLAVSGVVGWKAPVLVKAATVTNLAGTAVCNERTVDLSEVKGLFLLDEHAGEACYSVEEGGTGEAVLADDAHTLTVTKPGTIRIGVVTAPTETHESGEKVIAVLKVNNNSDRSGIRRAIALAGKKEKQNYTEESWNRLENVLEQAKDTAADANVFQKKLDQDEVSLLKSICRLSPEGDEKAADREVLYAIIASAESRKEEDYTEISWSDLRTVRSLAKHIADNEDSSAQEIQDVADLLIAVLEGLEPSGDSGDFMSNPVKVTKVNPEKDSITVPQGTTAQEVKEELGKLTFDAEVQEGIIPTLENDASIWEIEGYDADQAGDYRAFSVPVLPEGFAWASQTESMVSVTITVAKSGPTEEELARAVQEAKEAKEAAEAAKAEAEEAAFASAKAQEKAESAGESAVQAAEAAKNAQAKAEAAQAAAEKAQKAAEEAKQAAETDAAAAAEARAKAEIARSAAEKAKEEARISAETAKNAEKAAKDAKEAAETARSGAEAAQDKARTAAEQAVKAQKAVEDAGKDAKEAAEAAAAAKEAAQSAKAEAVLAKDSAVRAKNDAENAMKAAQMAQNASEAAAKSAEAQTKLAEAAAMSAKASADKAIAAQTAAEEAAKRAEAARKAAEEALKQAQAEAEEKLGEAQQILEEAERLRKETEDRVAVEEFRRSRVIIQSVKTGKNKAKVRWSKVEGAEGYVIQYAVRSGFRGAKEITVKSSTATAKTLRKLTGKKT